MNPAAGTIAAITLRPRFAGSSSVTASINNAGISTSPTTRVAVVITPAIAALPHRPLRAHQNAATLDRRNNDSLYGAMKTKEAGNDASSITERRATCSEYSSVVNPCRRMRARRNETFATSVAHTTRPRGATMRRRVRPSGRPGRTPRIHRGGCSPSPRCVRTIPHPSGTCRRRRCATPLRQVAPTPRPGTRCRSPPARRGRRGRRVPRGGGERL